MAQRQVNLDNLPDQPQVTVSTTIRGRGSDPSKPVVNLDNLPDKVSNPDQAFQDWYSAHAESLGLDPDPDSPLHMYDYRSAFAAGQGPDIGGHWPSQFKQPGHPNEVVGGFNTITGQPVGDVQASPDQLRELGWQTDPSQAQEPSLLGTAYDAIFNAPEFITQPVAQAGEALVENYPEGIKIPTGFGGLSVSPEAASSIANFGASMLSPANAISMLLPMLGVGGRLANIGTRMLGGAQVAHGGHEIYQGNTLEGLGDIAFGALDLKYPPSAMRLDTPKVAPPVEPPSYHSILSPPDAPMPDAEWKAFVEGLPPNPQLEITALEDLGDVPMPIGDRTKFNQTLDQMEDLVDNPQTSQQFVDDSPRTSDIPYRDEPSMFAENPFGTSDIYSDIPRVYTPGTILKPTGIDLSRYNKLIDQWNERIANALQDGNTEEAARFTRYRETVIRQRDEAYPHGEQPFTPGTLEQLGIGPTKVDETPVALTGGTPPQPPAANPVQKLKGALTESSRLNKDQAAIYKAERAEKFKNAEQIELHSEDDIPAFFGRLAGKHTKIDITPLRGLMEQPDIDKLVEIIGRSDLSTPETANAVSGLKRLLDGSLPRDYEISMLRRVFGGDIADDIRRFGPNKRDLVREWISLPKGLKSAFDIGWPFRQGINYAGRKAWRNAFLDSIKAWGSENYYQKGMTALRADPRFIMKSDSGLHLSDITSLSNREEAIMSTWAETGEFLPKPLRKGYAATYGNLVRRGNRAYALGLAQLRSNVWDDIYNQYNASYQALKRSGLPSDQYKHLNPEHQYLQDRISDMVNTATGRGSIGKLEAIAPELNATLFAPRLMSARMRSINRILNPVSYMNYDKIQRKEALKQFLSIAGVAMTTATAFKAGGADVGLDPDSSDFMKIRVGDTRIDALGGYQQYFVPLFKIGMGTATSTRPPFNQYELGSSPVAQNEFEVLLEAFLNKFSPPASLGVATLKGRDQAGNPTDFTSMNPFENTVTKSLVNSMLAEDLYELAKEDPALLMLMPLAATGMGVQVHSERQPQRR